MISNPGGFQGGEAYFGPLIFSVLGQRITKYDLKLFEGKVFLSPRISTPEDGEIIANEWRECRPQDIARLKEVENLKLICHDLNDENLAECFLKKFKGFRISELTFIGGLDPTKKIRSAGIERLVNAIEGEEITIINSFTSANNDIVSFNNFSDISKLLRILAKSNCGSSISLADIGGPGNANTLRIGLGEFDIGPGKIMMESGGTLYDIMAHSFTPGLNPIPIIAHSHGLPRGGDLLL